MKKIILLFLGLLVACHLQAQHCDSISNHLVEGLRTTPLDTPSTSPSFQLADGNILLVTAQSSKDESFNGLKFYKISRQGATILDSVSYEAKSREIILVARINDEGNPTYNQYCNVLVKVLHDSVNYQSNLNLSFFDDDIHFNEAMEVTVPFADTLVNSKAYRSTHCLLDSNNDIIYQYVIPTRDETYFDRFGLDGTLKHRTIIPRSVIPVHFGFDATDHFLVHGLRQCGKSPLKYNLYGTFGLIDVYYYQDIPNVYYIQEGNFVACELDSLFNIVNTFIIPPTDPDSFPYIHSCVEINGMVSLDDGTALVARNLRTEFTRQTTGIVKYDINGKMIKQFWFPDSYAAYTNWGSPKDTYYGFDLQKDGHGNVYYAFKCVIYRYEYITIAKLDEDLNPIWVRYGMNHRQSNNSFNLDKYSFGLTLLDHGGAVVFGKTILTGNYGWFMMLVDDADYGVTETDRSIRPYLLYPNPVEDHLTIHYSPDVKPLKVELLDLQGRLLVTQKANLESIDMQSLPVGTYTIRVVLDNGKTYSDKIIKQ